MSSMLLRVSLPPRTPLAAMTLGPAPFRSEVGPHRHESSPANQRLYLSLRNGR
jgi:hypothetical protein